MTVVSDYRIGKEVGPVQSSLNGVHADYYEADVISFTDYYPFGLEMPGRKNVVVSDRYRFGFNGKEKDEEGEFGSQTHYDYGFRIYNPGIGKFLSVDPLTSSYPWYTPYQFAGNMPVAAVDLDGLEPALTIVPRAPTRPLLRPIRGGGQGRAIEIHPNPYFNPRNPAVGVDPFIEIEVSEGFNLPSGPLEFRAQGTYGSVSNNPFLEKLKQSARDRLAQNSERRRNQERYDQLQRRLYDGEILTSAEFDFIDDFESGTLKGRTRGFSGHYGRQGVYVIYKNGEPFKFGKAHLEGKLDDQGRPDRLSDQVEGWNGRDPDNVYTGEVLNDFTGYGQEALDIELEYMLEYGRQNGKWPEGNVDDPRLQGIDPASLNKKP